MHRCKLWLCNVKFLVRRRQSDRLVRADGHWFAERRTTATDTWQASGEHVLYNVAFVLRFTPQPAAQAIETLLLQCCCANHCQSVKEKKIDACRARRQKWHPRIVVKQTQRGQSTFVLNENKGVEIVLDWTKRCDRTWKRKAGGGWSAFESPVNWREKVFEKRGKRREKNKWKKLRTLSKLSRAEEWWSELWAGVEEGGPGRLYALKINEETSRAGWGRKCKGTRFRKVGWGERKGHQSNLKIISNFISFPSSTRVHWNEEKNVKMLKSKKKNVKMYNFLHCR